MNLLTDKQPIHTGATAVYQYTPALESLFTVKPKFDEPFSMAVRKGNMLHVPRGCVPIGMEDYRVEYPRAAINCKKPARSQEQADLIKQSVALLLSGQDHVFEAPTGFGKCALKGETVLLYSGHLKKVEDVVVGDVLMGPDSTPRTVMSLGSGVTQAYELRTPRGEVLRFNEDHILCLEATSGGDFKEGTRCEVSLKDYLSWSKTKKHQFKLYKPSIVLFPEQKPPIVDAYVLGLLLGDGCLKDRVSLTTVDPELVGAFTSECAKYNTTVDTRGISYYSSSSMRGAGGEGLNPFIDAVRALGLMGTDSESKFVPWRYRMGSVETRLQLIAGLIDSDGHLNGGCFDYVSKSQQLANDLAFMCWSVGLAAVVSPCRKVCTTTGIENTYYRVGVSGDTSRVPTRLVRKQAAPRKQKKSVLRHGFTITDLGQQEYFGFQLDGDHRYLTGNFFVTHNTYCGAAIAAEVGQPTLIIVTKQDLMTSWHSTLVNLIGIPASEIGILQADKKKWKGCRFVLGMVHSLVIPDKYEDEVFRYFGMIIFDEVHRMAADNFAAACTLFPAKHRLGLSATPDRPDGKFPVVQAHIGPVMVRGKAVPMKPKILVKKTGWKIPKVKRFENGVWIQKTLEHAPGRMAGVSKAQGSSYERNAIISDFVASSFSAGRNTLILSDLLDGHLTPLFHSISKAGVPAEEIDYYVGGRSKIELEIASKKRVVLATYAMCSEGTDCPWWDTLVLATPRSNVKQAIGRVMRFLEGKKQPVILDLLDSDSIFSAFYGKREVQYFSVGAEIIKL